MAELNVGTLPVACPRCGERVATADVKSTRTGLDVTIPDDQVALLKTHLLDVHDVDPATT